MNLINVSDWSRHDILKMWARAEHPECVCPGITIGWSFEGNGVRTRSSFLQAFRDLSVTGIELPNLLKTRERPQDLAGYLDPIFSAYVIRESDHDRLAEFARATSRPVINAMSSVSHPCEVLTDAWYIDRFIRPIEQARIGLWGPTTNVFRAWHELAQVLGLDLRQIGDGLGDDPTLLFEEIVGDAKHRVDIVITDGGGDGSACPALTVDVLHGLGEPKLLPTPPFTIGRELAFDPVTYPGFVGYSQKRHLLPVQKAILCACLGCP